MRSDIACLFTFTSQPYIQFSRIQIQQNVYWKFRKLSILSIYGNAIQYSFLFFLFKGKHLDLTLAVSRRFDLSDLEPVFVSAALFLELCSILVSFIPTPMTDTKTKKGLHTARKNEINRNGIVPRIETFEHLNIHCTTMDSADDEN